MQQNEKYLCQLFGENKENKIEIHRLENKKWRVLLNDKKLKDFEQSEIGKAVDLVNKTVKEMKK